MEQRIGRYQILEEIAAGGQGTVYRAFDPDSGQIIALKVLHPTLSGDRGYIERFRREASLAASIDHPNVVKIFEVGQDGDQHFIALEFLPESLSRVVESGGQMRLEGAAQFGLQIAEGLGAAHALGIVHRDIKPQNVLIGPDGTAKVTDFGIARAESLNTMTATGVVMGTPHYMSPEQARGERADARSDVYSLGCMMYHMLAGEVPFTGETPLAVIRQQIEVQPRRLRERRKDVPRSLEAVIDRAMAKDPKRRYQSAGEIAQAIRAAAPGVSRPITPQARRVAPPPAVTPPQATPQPPSTTWMNAWANAWGKAHRRRWAWVGTLIPLTLAVAVAGVRLDAYDYARDWIESTGLLDVVRVKPLPGEPKKSRVIVVSAAEAPASVGPAPALPQKPASPLTPAHETAGVPPATIIASSVSNVAPAGSPPITSVGSAPALPQEPPSSLMPANRTAQVPPTTIIASSVSDVGPAGSPPITREVAPSPSAFFKCLVGIFGGTRAQDMLTPRYGPTNDEIRLIQNECQEESSKAGFNVAPIVVAGGQPLVPGAAPGIPPALAARLGPLYECMVGVVGSDRASEMFVSGERPVGDEAVQIFDACQEELNSAGLLQGPEFVREPRPRLDEPTSQASDQTGFNVAPFVVEGGQPLLAGSAPDMPPKLAARLGPLFECMVGVVGSDRASEMFASGERPVGDEAVQIFDACQEELKSAGLLEGPELVREPRRRLDEPTSQTADQAGFNVAPSVVEGSQPLLADAAPGIPPEMAAKLGPLFECMVGVVGSDRASEMFASGERPVGDEAYRIFNACQEELNSAGLLEAPEIVREPRTRLDEPSYQTADPEQRSAEVLGPYMERESGSYMVVASDSSWKVSDFEQPGWNELGFDDRSWLNAGVYWEYWDHDNVQSAQPIWYPDRHEDDFNWYFFRKSFEVPMVEPIGLAELTIQVDDDYVLFLNGVEIGRDESGVTEAPTTYDVLPYLHAGENLIAVAAVDSAGGSEGVVLALGMGPAGGDVPIALGDANPGIHVIAYVDGRSQLLVRGRFAQWFHMENAAPGREEPSDFPTILNGTEWLPEWPDDPDAENRDCFCESSVFEGLEPALPTHEMDIRLQVLIGRGPVSIVELPGKANEFTLILEIDDNDFDGSDWYELVIVADPRPTAVLAPGVGLLRGATISGRVTDAETDLPIADIRIETENADCHGYRPEAWTDAQGRYALQGLAPGDYRIRAATDERGYILQYFGDTLECKESDLVTVYGSDSAEGIDFALRSGATISGRVFDAETGLPVADIRIDTENADCHGYRPEAWTDAQGRYALQGLAPGDYRIRAATDERGYILQYFGDTLECKESDLVTLYGSESAEGIDFALRSGATISGRVFDAETGLPIPNIRIRADSIFDEPGADGDTDADGRFELRGIAPGTYKIRAEGERKGYIRTFYDSKLGWDNGDLVTVSGRSSVEGIDFGLKRGTSASGRVIDDESGLPISNIGLSARLPGGDEVAWSRTDADGNYKLRGLPIGIIEVRTPGEEYIRERVKVMTVDAQAVAVQDLRLRLGATISGRVVDAVTGEPIADVNLVADGVNGTGSHMHARTDSDGRYVFGGVGPGSYKIRARTEDRNYIQQYYKDTLDWDDAQTVSVTGQQPIENIDIRLTLGASISGRVVDGATGSPIVNMDARAELLDGRDFAWSNTDSEGRYMLRGVPDGVIEVVVQGQGYIEVRKTVTVQDGIDVTGFDF